VHVTDDVEAKDSLERGEAEEVSRQHLDLLATLVEQRWCERPRRIIVAVEAVRGAVEVYCRLKEASLPQLFSQINLFLYHGRLDDRQRTRVYQQLKALDDHLGSTYVLVTTSAIEVGCDLNAETLITEICPPDSLVQRSGRCNRRGNFNDTAEVVVVGSRIPEFVCTLSEEQEQKFIALLQANNGNMLNSQVIEALLACLDRPLLVDPRAKTAFEMLYEFVYEFALENQPLYERGFIATRGWEPTLPLVIYDNNKVEAEISIEVSRLAGTIQEPPAGVFVEEWRLGEDTWEWHWATPPRPGSLYEREIRVRVNDPSVCGYTSELGFVDLPKVFAYRSRRGGYEVRLAWFLPNESQTETEGVLFVDKDTKNGKKKEIFFRYLSDPELIEVLETSEAEGAEISGEEEVLESEESEE
jgi:CRISPR-associated endonuclease/helicase Cas3